MDGVDFVYGCHLWTPLEYGKVAACGRPFMAAADFFTLTITGRGGHAGLPHTAIDTIAIAAQVVTSLQHVVSRRIDPLAARGGDDRRVPRRRRAERDPGRGRAGRHRALVRPGVRERIPS
jgi:amidohydrolase